jgi:hypothetical protein
MTATAPTIAEQIEWLKNMPIGDVCDARHYEFKYAILASLRSVEALQRDAARYRWLRSGKYMTEVEDTLYESDEYLKMDGDLDSAIDTAIGAS